MSDAATRLTGAFAEAYAALPPLPLPDLDKTAERYLASVKPLLDDAGYAQAEAAIAELLSDGGAGRRLHSALAQRASASDNWLSQWWDNVAYLDLPDPVLINSNFGISCDARQPVDEPAARGAEVAARTLDIYHLIATEMLPVETVGRAQIPLDMSLMKRVLASARVPGAQRDVITVYGPETARHIVVIRKNRFYAVPAMDASGRVVSVADLEAEFRAIIADADAAHAAEGAAPPLAALTTQRRPVWAEQRARLIADPANAESVAAIESAVFVMIFDDRSHDGFNFTARAAIHGAPGERWMDKVFSYIVDDSGRVSQHGEHSPADGMQFVTIFDHGCDAAERGVFRRRPEETERRRDAVAMRRLTWNLSDQILADVAGAATHFEQAVDDLDLEVLHFDAFGKGEIKTLGVGPDPFVQLGYQLAFTRLHGRTPKTYESAQTRMFKLGRTETIRTASVESKAFTDAMANPSIGDATRAELFRAAAAEHAQRGQLASQGQASDRHLLGLKLLAAELGEPAPALFEQEVWTRGWELSTAQLPMRALLVNGFGPVTPSGYGIGYVIQDPTVTCHITSFRSHPDTSSKAFAETLAACFGEIRALLKAHPAA